MKKVAIEHAVGETLFHDITAISDDGFKGVRFRRGHIISQGDIPAFKAIGKNHVFIGRPGPDDVHEDDAAAAIAQALCGSNLTLAGPSEGKMVISSTQDGLFCLNRKALVEINRVEDFTIACIHGYSAVEKGQKLAGARIVPLMTRYQTVSRAVAIAEKNSPVMQVLPYRPLICGLVITGSEIHAGLVADRFAPVMIPRLERYGARIRSVVKCPDDTKEIRKAILDLCSQGVDLVLLSGGMSVDPDDLTPGAIRSSGARVIMHGVPMQPGNMLMLARLGSTMLVGVPGASIHSPITSLDVFLPRLFAGVEINADEIALFGEGGFCRQCPVCHYPVCTFGRPAGGG